MHRLIQERVAFSFGKVRINCHELRQPSQFVLVKCLGIVLYCFLVGIVPVFLVVGTIGGDHEKVQFLVGQFFVSSDFPSQDTVQERITRGTHRAGQHVFPVFFAQRVQGTGRLPHLGLHPRVAELMIDVRQRHEFRFGVRILLGIGVQETFRQ